jgi:hypothetical protein
MPRGEPGQARELSHDALERRPRAVDFLRGSGVPVAPFAAAQHVLVSRPTSKAFVWFSVPPPGRLIDRLMNPAQLSIPTEPRR